PDIDPANIGPSNYKTLQNLRYKDDRLEGISGYSKINTTALTTYLKIRNGHHFRSSYDQSSYVLVQAENTGLTASQILQNQTAIGDQGDFEGTALHTDATGAGIGRFITVGDDVIYCNGKETMIWGGEESRCSTFFTCDDGNRVNPIEHTEKINNTLSDSSNIVSIGTQKFWLILTPRPIKGVKYTVKTPNDTASTTSAKVWNGTIFTAVSGWEDGTKPDTISLAQSGSMTFTSTVGTAVPFHFQGLYLYAYLFEIDAGTAELSFVTVDAPWQALTDIWDGVKRQPIAFQVYRANTGTFEDYTLQVNESSFEEQPIGGVLDGLSTSDYVVAMFDERTSAIDFTLLGTLVNQNAASITIYYWNGTAWTSVGTVTDGTLSSSKVWGQSGLMNWTPPAVTSEHMKELFGKTGYAYKFVVSAKLSGAAPKYVRTDITFSKTANPDTITTAAGNFITAGVKAGVYIEIDGTDLNNGVFAVAAVTATVITLADGVLGADEAAGDTVTFSIDRDPEIVIDLVSGIPTQQSINSYKFPASYKNRLLLCGADADKQGNRVDYSAANIPQALNGDESSKDGEQSLFFGTSDGLTCGTQLYNRFGSSIITSWLALKNHETYLLTGDGPEDFQIFTVSLTVGCPAPLTLDNAEVGFVVSENVERNVAIWLSSSGPMMFDGAVLVPIRGIDMYFDPNETACINFDYIENSRGWFDAVYKEYNLLIPSGVGQTTNNKWFVYDLSKKKWYEKSTSAAERPQCAFRVIDEYGTQYIYSGIDTGYMMLLEDSTSWDGIGITQNVASGDLWPTGSIWDQTRIRRVKIVAKRITEDHDLKVIYYSDTNMTEGSDVVWTDGDVIWTYGDVVFVSAELATLELSVDTGINRLVRTTAPVDLVGWSHGFGFQLTTSDSLKGFQPISYAIEYQYVRKDR
ncbi:MAG: hypothetical protein ABIC04_01235, partial [Nanoarchaeota archaeon]